MTGLHARQPQHRSAPSGGSETTAHRHARERATRAIASESLSAAVPLEEVEDEAAKRP